MKLVMTLLVRDEQDILRENLDFHLAHGVDEIILMDNRSVDGTADIAREYERAGYLHYMFQPQDDYSQGRWVTQMARRAVDELRADWVINNDADEFWWPRAGSLKDALASIGSEPIAATVERSNFVTRVDNGQPFWQRMDVRSVVSVNALGEPLPGKAAHRAVPGRRRRARQSLRVRRRRAPPSAAAPITILHFPVRSRAQFHNKIVKGGAAYARNTELPYGYGMAWRRLYQLHLEGRLDEAYDSALLTDDQVAAGLAAGELVRDRRLIAALGSRTQVLSDAC